MGRPFYSILWGQSVYGHSILWEREQETKSVYSLRKEYKEQEQEQETKPPGRPQTETKESETGHHKLFSPFTKKIKNKFLLFLNEYPLLAQKAADFKLFIATRKKQ